MTDQSRRRFLKGATAAMVGTAFGTPAYGRARRIDGFNGRIVEKGDSVYESWRQAMVWQMRKPDRYPEFIVRPETAQDVGVAVRFASANGMPVSTKSGGHNIWGACLRDNSMLIDLSRFKHANVREGRGTARVGPSLWARDLIEYLGHYDYSFPVAHCATVPLGGYILGGGLGLNGDEWDGIASNCVTGGTVVTASGEVVKVSESENSDLLWAMRGGGSIPGIMVDCEIKTFSKPGGIFSSTYVFPLAMLDDALVLLNRMVDLEPRNTELLALMLHNPQAGPDAPPEMQKAIAIRAQVYEDSEDAAATTLDAIAAIPEASKSVFQLPALQESFEKLFVDSMDWRRGFGFGRFAVENGWTNDLTAAVTDIASDFLQATSWKSHVVIQPKLADVSKVDGAFSVAGNAYVGIYGVWDNAVEDPAGLAWLKTISATLDRHAVGHYINEIELTDDATRQQRCFSDSAWERLETIRASWDPDRVFYNYVKPG